MPTQIHTQAVAKFKCLGDQCADTCCKGWGMQLHAETVEKYRREAPELLDAVTQGEAEFVMRRDPATDYCVKLDAGWCSIHRDYGEEFLGDACHLFPRVTRALGDIIVTTAALSCPETARQMLYEADATTFVPRSEVRVPFILRNYLPNGLPAEDALALHQRFLEAVSDEQYSVEHAFMRVSTVVQALVLQPEASWNGASEFYFRMAEGRIPAAETSPYDMFNLLHALQGLVQANRSSKPRLLALLEQMTSLLGVSFDANAQHMTLGPDAMARALAVSHHMQSQRSALQPVLRRYVLAEFSESLFPFGGLGQTLTERTVILGVRLATMKLALATLDVAPADHEVVEVVQTLSRFIDHLADGALSLNIYKETGWTREPRLRSLLGD